MIHTADRQRRYCAPISRPPSPAPVFRYLWPARIRIAFILRGLPGEVGRHQRLESNAWLTFAVGSRQTKFWASSVLPLPL